MFAIHKRLYATVDGNRAYTGLTHGFLNQLLGLKQQYEGKIILVWDAGIQRRRHLDKDYKRKRRDKEWDELDLFLDHQHVLRYFLGLVKVRQVKQEGEEGDDVLYTLSRHTTGRKLIVSNDHDLHQALTPEVFQLITRRGDYNLFGMVKLKKKFGTTPEQYSDAMAIAGCSGDGVAGVKGIGMKTAIAVVKKWPLFVHRVIGCADNGYSFLSGSLFFKKEYKPESAKEKKIIEEWQTIAKTQLLTKLYDLWPLKIKMGTQDLEKLELELERYELHELASKLHQFPGLLR